jgi:hypothetical protein
MRSDGAAGSLPRTIGHRSGSGRRKVAGPPFEGFSFFVRGALDATERAVVGQRFEDGANGFDLDGTLETAHEVGDLFCRSRDSSRVEAPDGVQHGAWIYGRRHRKRTLTGWSFIAHDAHPSRGCRRTVGRTATRSSCEPAVHARFRTWVARRRGRENAVGERVRRSFLVRSSGFAGGKLTRSSRSSGRVMLLRRGLLRTV